MKPEHLIEQKLTSATKLEDLAFVLKNLLAYHSVWDDGSLLSIRQLVDFVEGLRIEIYHTEHPPPHFHVIAAGINASFTIRDGQLLDGAIGGRERKMVEWWYQRSRQKLVEFWNATRPTDCPVGPIS